MTTTPLDRNRITRVTDSTGRILGVRRIGVVQRMRMLEAVGPENARNAPYMGLALMALAVVEIDGELCEPVSTKRQLEARAQQLDEHGLAAVGAVLAAADAAAGGQDGATAGELAKNV